jgi:hypothetical protein
MTGQSLDNSNFNFIEELFSRELHSILEKIIFVLPLQALTTFLNVSDRWKDILRFYNDKSKNSRIRQILEVRKSREWRKKKPRVFKFNFEQFYIFQIDCLHITGDEREAVIAARINKTEVIFIFHTIIISGLPFMGETAWTTFYN